MDDDELKNRTVLFGEMMEIRRRTRSGKPLAFLRTSFESSPSDAGSFLRQVQGNVRDGHGSRRLQPIYLCCKDRK